MGERGQQILDAVLDDTPASPGLPIRADSLLLKKKWLPGADAYSEKQTCNVLFCVPAVETVHMKIRRLILMLVLTSFYSLFTLDIYFATGDRGKELNNIVLYNGISDNIVNGIV
jgi:hypothetical protein